VCVETRIEGTVRRLPAGITLSAYRIIQEALTNVVRHAGPTTAHLKLTYHPEELEIELIDEGPGDGFRPGGAASPVRGGNGLIGMRERVALYGGRLSTGQTGRGFRVAASLPTGGDPR
jgi:signal transduction histidine kinase